MSLLPNKPAWRVRMDGRDLTSRLAPRLIELSLTEQRGEEADQLELTLHDHDGAVALPARGVLLSVALGWEGFGLIDKGLFKVDEVEHSGAPDVISIRARSADMAAGLRVKRDRSFDATTVGAIVSTIAGDHGLIPRVASALDRRAVDHLDQAGESDLNLLTRLGKRFDAVATVKNGHLLFLPMGAAQTSGGQALARLTLSRRSGDGHRFSQVDRDTYTGIEAAWQDTAGGEQRLVQVGEGDNRKRLRTVYASEAEAREAADSELGRVKRGAAALSLRLAYGRPEIEPETPVTVRGFKPEIDGTDWRVTKATHRMGSGGLGTELEMERGG